MKVESTEVTAHVSIGKDTDGGFGLSAVLDVHVAGVSHSEAQELVEVPRCMSLLESNKRKY